MRPLASVLYLVIINLSAGVVAPMPMGAQPDSTFMFPRVEGANLEGTRFSLPADFDAEYSVLFVAFRREQQSEVDSWLPFVREQKLAERGVRVYELPTLSRGYQLMRRFIDGGMARGIPEKATRQATITLYIDKAPFKKALGIAAEDRISTMLVASDGRVLWHGTGAFTPVLGARLAAAIEATRPSGPRPSSDPESGTVVAAAPIRLEPALPLAWCRLSPSGSPPTSMHPGPGAGS